MSTDPLPAATIPVSFRDVYPPAWRTTCPLVPIRNNPGWLSSYASHFSSSQKVENCFCLLPLCEEKTEWASGQICSWPRRCWRRQRMRHQSRTWSGKRSAARYDQLARRLRENCSNCWTPTGALEPGGADWETPLAQYAEGRTGRARRAEPRCAPTPPPTIFPASPTPERTSTHSPRQRRAGAGWVGSWLYRLWSLGVSTTEASVIRTGFRTYL